MGTIKKGKKYFLGFPLYYRLFAPLWDQLKPYSLKKPPFYGQLPFLAKLNGSFNFLHFTSKIPSYV